MTPDLLDRYPHLEKSLLCDEPMRFDLTNLIPLYIHFMGLYQTPDQRWHVDNEKRTKMLKELPGRCPYPWLSVSFPHPLSGLGQPLDPVEVEVVEVEPNNLLAVKFSERGYMIGSAMFQLENSFWTRMGDMLLGDTIRRSLTAEQCDEVINCELKHLATFVWMFLQLVNCRNVSIQDKPNQESRQQRRARERRGDPKVVYKVLNIKVPGDNRSHSGGDASGDPTALPLHVVRGHFKTYTSDRPLFGKLTGTFWVAAHTRGEACNGSVEKEYRVG